MKDKVRPFYEELMGYLSQAPAGDTVTYVRDASLWQQYNGVIDELNKISGQDYNKFKITNIKNGPNGLYVLNSEYRSKLNGLIMRLHGEYFQEETFPFSGSPNTVVHQNQSQSQTAQAQVVMLLEFQNLIHEKLNKTQDEKEKGFLESIKSKLVNVRNVADLVQLLLTTAKTFSLTIEQLKKIFT